jgi:hypothetical protein
MGSTDEKKPGDEKSRDIVTLCRVNMQGELSIRV